MRQHYSERYRVAYGRPNRGTVLSIESDAKTVRSVTRRFLQAILYLPPHIEMYRQILQRGGVIPEGKFSWCHGEVVAACFADCLFWAGRGRTSPVEEARFNRGMFLLDQPTSFWSQVRVDLEQLRDRAYRRKLAPLFRPNGTTGDTTIRQVGFDIATDLGIQAFDYSGSIEQAFRYLGTPTPVTFSYKHPRDEADARYFLEMGGNVAVPYVGERLPELWGYPTIDGDEHDVRLPAIDGMGKVVALKQKHSRADRQAIERGFVLDWRP